MKNNEYKVGDKVQVNMGSDKDPIWINMEVCETHPLIPHIQVKLPVHPSTVRKGWKQQES